MTTRTYPATGPQLRYVAILRGEIFDIHRELRVIAGDTEAVEALDDGARELTVHTNDVRDFAHARRLIDHGKEAVARLRRDLSAARATVAEIDAAAAPVERLVDVADTTANPAAAAVPATKFDSQTLPIGIYELKGKIYKIKLNKDKTRRYAMELTYDVGEIERLTAAGGRIKAEYVYAKGVIYSLRPEHRITGERAEQLMIVFENCIVCGRHLKAAESVERAIGPVCWKNNFRH